jgi:hypothetical protein
VIELRIESPAPSVRCCWANDSEGGRVLDWLDQHPELLDLCGRALELEREAEAA